MNTVTGNDILAYQGNVGLGLNSEGIVEYGDTDAKLLNESLFNLAYMNMQKNKNIYDQKIKDRDDTFKMIASGQLQLDQVLDVDRPKLMEKLQKVKDIYFNAKGDIKSDPNKYLEFQQAMAEFNEANVYGKHRFVEIRKQQAEQAKTERKDLKDAMQKNIDANIKKGLYEMVTPFQQAQDYQLNGDLFVRGQPEATIDQDPASGTVDANGNVVIKDDGYGTGKSTKNKLPNQDLMKFYKTTTITTPDGYETETNAVLDFDKLVTDANVNYSKNDGAGGFYTTNDAVKEFLTTNGGAEHIKLVNKAIEEYNKETGSNVTPLGVQIDENGNAILGADGKLISTDTIPVLKAKINLLGGNYKFSQKAYNQDALKAGKIKAEIKTEGSIQQLNKDKGIAVKKEAEAAGLVAKGRYAKDIAEANDIKDKKIQKEKVAHIAFDMTKDVFDPGRYTNGSDIKNNLSEDQIRYITRGINIKQGNSSVLKYDNIKSIVYDNSNPYDPKLKITTNDDKSYTTRPRETMMGAGRSIVGETTSGKESDFVVSYDDVIRIRTGSRDINRNLISTIEKESKNDGYITVYEWKDGKAVRESSVDKVTADALINGNPSRYKLTK